MAASSSSSSADVGAEWTLVPSSPRDIDAVRQQCRRLVLRRAALSAGVSAVPLPGIDVAADLSLLAALIDDINRAFCLTPAQIERMRPQQRVLAYRLIVSTGSAFVGKVVTRELAVKVLHKMGAKTLAKQASRFVPLAGQAAAAAIGFAAFRAIGNQHVEACARILVELGAAPPA